MSEDAYLKVSCPNCESQYAVDYVLANVSEEEPCYCPFCSELIPSEDNDDRRDELEEEEQREDSR